MRKPSDDRVEFHLEADSAREPRETSDGEPFRIALLGDYTGSKDRIPLTQRKPILIDRDNFDSVLENLKVSIDLPTGVLAISEMDDFHPDRIYSTYPMFAKLRGVRDKLADPETFAETMRELTGEALPPAPGSSGNLLDEIIGGGGTGTAARPARRVDDLQRFIDDAVRPLLVARTDPRAPEMVRKVDEATAGMMRALLHHENFQAIESAWRSLFLIIRQLETGTDLKVYILDVTADELAAHPDTVYQRLTVRQEPWAVLAGNFAFGPPNAQVLANLGKVAAKLQAPFLGEADASALDASPVWAKLRALPESRYVGLTLPRVLLRMPYGKKTSPCEQFDFEEVSGRPSPKDLLFGNAAPFCAMLLGQAFEQSGWDLKPGMVRDITGLPVYVYEFDGESAQHPNTDIELTQETAEALIENGFMPIASIRNRDIARALMFQSISEPPAAIPGRWQ